MFLEAHNLALTLEVCERHLKRGPFKSYHNFLRFLGNTSAMCTENEAVISEIWECK